MKISATILTAALLMIIILLLAGCTPLPYQGSCDSYTEVIIIHEPGPYPIPYPYPPPDPDQEPPRRPVPDRNVPLTRDTDAGEQQTRIKNPDRMAGRTVERSPRKR